MAGRIRTLVLRHKGVEVHHVYREGKLEMGAWRWIFRTVAAPKLATHPTDFDLRALPPDLTARIIVEAPDSPRRGALLRETLAAAIEANLVTRTGGPIGGKSRE